MAEQDLNNFKKKFLEIIHELIPDAIEFNPSSTQQLQQLLHAPFKRVKLNKEKEETKDTNKIKLDNEFWKEESDNYEINFNKDNNMTLKQTLDTIPEEDKLKVIRNFKVIDYYDTVRSFKVEKIPDYDYSTIITDEHKKKLKYREMKITGFGIPAKKISLTGLPSVDIDALQELSKGPINQHFK